MAKKVTLRDTKNAIFKAYQEAIAEAEKLNSQLRIKDQQLSKASSAAPVTKTVTKVVKAGGPVEDVTAIIGSLEQIYSGISKAIGDNSSRLVSEAEQLEDVQGKIGEEQEEIQSLYDIELGEGTLEELIDKYIDTKETFETNYEEKSNKYDNEIKEKKEAWKKEREEHNANTRERDHEATKTAKREREEHDYKLKQERAEEDDIYAQKKKGLEEELSKIREEKDAENATREKEVKDKENEYDDYEEKYLALDAKLDKERSVDLYINSKPASQPLTTASSKKSHNPSAKPK
ncbi:MAG: hypothetical protein MK212_13705, partial [Saprospiraceae bacterium]|nr:hypothetical protein [Saprospiraceae bacterium]